MTERKSNMRLGVRGKLVTLLVGTAFVALLLACASFVYYDRASYTEAKRATLSVLVESVAQSAFGPTAFADPDSARVILKVLEAEPSALAGGIYGQEVPPLAVWHRSGSETSLPPNGSGLVVGTAGGDGRMSITRDIQKDGQVAGKLHVVFSTADIAQRTKRFLQIAGGVLLLSVLLATLFSALGHVVFTRPVSLLSEAALRVQRDQDFDVRARRVSDDELGGLTDAFNAMLGTIQARDRQLEEHRAGLERQVAERTRHLDARNQEMRLVLDNVDQGFVTLDRDGVIGAERSATFDEWFEPCGATTRFSAHLGQKAAKFEAYFDMCWGELLEGVLPLEVCLGQLPQQLQTSQGKHYSLAYRPIGESEDSFDQILVVVSDVTTQIEKERNDAEQAELLAAFEHISADRGGFLDFFIEAEEMVRRVTSDESLEPAVVLRGLHTLKGNCGLFGLKSLVGLVHSIEDYCIESGELPGPADKSALQTAWDRFGGKVRGFLGDLGSTLTIGVDDLKSLVDAVRANASYAELVVLTSRLARDPVAPKLERMAEHARKLADRLGKAPVTVRCDANSARLSKEQSWLWHILPHVVANAVDHGLDAPDERAKSGKKDVARLHFTARETGSQLVLEISDNGRGIDFAALARRAREYGLPSGTEAELIEAMFHDGVTTRTEATDVSGRGVGLAAVRAACREHRATVTVKSVPGQGTTFVFVVPLGEGTVESHPPPKASASVRPPSEVQRFSSRPRPSAFPSSA